MINTVHIPILVEPIIDALLAPLRALSEEADPQWLVDCTLGGGGHTAALLAALASDPKLRRHKLLSIDRDPSAIARAAERFETELSAGRLEIVHSPFGSAADLVRSRPVAGLMADLGFSSDQMNDPARGFSFQTEGPLDMRLDPSRGQSAREFLSRIPERELEEVLSKYGEERFSRRIAGAIVEHRRKHGPPSTTRELSDVVVRAVPPNMRHGRIHAATRTFQAIRIAVNEELEELDCLLKRVILGVKPGGRVAILSFHSLEDRMVKHAFRSAPFKPLHKKPIEADDEEVRRNPRARSAKLRIAERQPDESAGEPNGGAS
ncbi:MAG: 16S rRNA (cytosine(1402)-N(4))-methyltransferase [Bdellovibrionales bacterium GWB1_55_8]|nr:MAG: 16S rRNA (cytosine(1402)-N(4))-methyltransferase [Bdellovibrionales bacterium GWB1_55_8]